MAARRAQQISGALLSKGFRYRDNDHTYLILYVDGKQTSVRTRISHGISDYGDDLLGKMSRQLSLKKSELLQLIDCPMSFQRYVQVLKKAGVVSLDD